MAGSLRYCGRLDVSPNRLRSACDRVDAELRSRKNCIKCLSQVKQRISAEDRIIIAARCRGSKGKRSAPILRSCRPAKVAANPRAPQGEL